MNKSLTFLFCITTTAMTGCAEAIDTLYALNQTDIEAYDSGVCKNGEPSLPGKPKRFGCVNNKSQFNNKADFLKYKKERTLYLNNN